MNQHITRFYLLTASALAALAILLMTTPTHAFDAGPRAVAKQTLAPESPNAKDPTDAGDVALEIALPRRPDASARYYEFSRGERRAEEYRANRHLSAKELATVLQNEYGVGSIMGRTATLLAKGATAIEKTVQFPLDGLNLLSEGVIHRARNVPGLGALPFLKLRARLRVDEIEVGFRARW